MTPRFLTLSLTMAFATLATSAALAINVPLGGSWLLNEGAGLSGENTAQLSSNSATGYTYLGEGTTGNVPATSNPDSRKRPKVYNDFAPANMSAVGSVLSMTYDILWNGTERPSNESQDWRFGFVSTGANGGLGLTLGANFDIGNLSGTTYYEFYSDPEIDAATTASGVPAGEMDFAFTGTNNSLNIDGATDNARIAQSQNDPFNTGTDVTGDYNDDQTVDAADYTVWRDNEDTSNPLPNDTVGGTIGQTQYDNWADNYGAVDTEDIVAFNDTTDTHRVVLSLTRTVDGYDLQFDWTNLDRIVDGVNPTITHTATISTSDSFTSTDPFGSAAIAAGVTSWDRLGFFINANDNRSPTPDEPWSYVMSNVAVDYSPGLSISVPEPSTALLALTALACASSRRRR